MFIFDDTMATIPIPHFVWSALRIGLASYVGLCLLMFIFQSHYVYFPSPTVQFTPASLALPFEDVTLASNNGRRIAAWFVPASAARGTALVCHGNGGNIGANLHNVLLFHNLGLNVFIFDYQGYGQSEGKPSEAGTYADALAAWNHLTGERGIPADRIILHGQSLGGAVAAWLAGRQQPAGLILDSTFTSMPDIGARLYWYLPVRLLCRYRYPTLDYVRRIHCPLLVAHSRQDDMIPFAHGRKLYEAGPEPKAFTEFAGMHNDGLNFIDPSSRGVLEEFLKRCLGNGKTG